jgi:hypothetical protein
MITSLVKRYGARMRNRSGMDSQCPGHRRVPFVRSGNNRPASAIARVTQFFAMQPKDRPMEPEIRDAFWKALDHSPFMMVRLAEADSSGQPMTAMLDADARKQADAEAKAAAKAKNIRTLVAGLAAC